MEGDFPSMTIVKNAQEPRGRACIVQSPGILSPPFTLGFATDVHTAI
jgi:hypothetical protein